MNITIFTIWAFARLLEAHYEDKMVNQGEIYISLPKYICDSTLKIYPTVYQVQNLHPKH